MINGNSAQEDPVTHDDHTPMLPRTRREALKTFGAGLGMTYFAALAGQPLAAAAESSRAIPGTPKPPHFAPKAKHVIVVFLHGGLSQIDSFDYKPMLDKYDGKPLPYETPRTEFADRQSDEVAVQLQEVRAERHRSQRALPAHRAKIIDEFCIVRSMISDIPNHGPSVLMMNTGSVRAGRPSMGSWVVYGLGTENQNLPGFIVLSAGGRRRHAATARRFCRRSIRARWFPIKQRSEEADPVSGEHAA